MAEHWESTERADGQMSRQVLLMLITVPCLPEADAIWGQKAAPRSATRMGGRVME